MLHDAQRTSAPRATSVSISTAVWIVMCSEPVIRAPFSGCASAYSARVCIRPGISCSASSISLRPYSARPRSATLKSCAVSTAVGFMGLLGGGRLWSCMGCGQRQQLGVLVLLPAQPFGRRDVLRALRLGGEPGIDGG